MVCISICISLLSLLPSAHELGSTIGTAARIRAGWFGVRIPADDGFFLSSKTCRQTLEPIQPHIQAVRGFFTCVALQGCEVHYTFQPGFHVKNEWSYASNPTIRLHGRDKNKCTFFAFCFSQDLIFNLLFLLETLPPPTPPTPVC
jgi:hypothetical protein